MAVIRWPLEQKKKKTENANVATAAIFWVTTLCEAQMAVFLCCFPKWHHLKGQFVSLPGD